MFIIVFLLFALTWELDNDDGGKREDDEGTRLHIYIYESTCW